MKGSHRPTPSSALCAHTKDGNRKNRPVGIRPSPGQESHILSIV